MTMVASGFDRKRAAVEIKRLRKRGAEPHQIGAALIVAMKDLGRRQFWAWVTKDCELTRKDARRCMVDRGSESLTQLGIYRGTAGTRPEDAPSDHDA